ncbi:MAG: ATP-binding protein [Nocardioides sp.]|nr:ATP-binding protein [Nocardioides sp.]
MEVKIGVQYAPRELVVDTDAAPEEVEQMLSNAVGATDGVLSLTDSKGRRVLVPAAKIAYVEIGSTTVGAVGFRS